MTRRSRRWPNGTMSNAQRQPALLVSTLVSPRARCSWSGPASRCPRTSCPARPTSGSWCGPARDSTTSISDHLASAGIRLLRVPGPGARAVAELTFGLILAVARRIVEADRQVREGTWRKHELAGPLLEDKVLGIVGAGNIGSTVGRLGVAWGMHAVGCIAGGNDVSRARLEGSGIAILDLDAVVSAADILTIHVPLLPTTRNLVGASVIARLRPGSIVVNAARGGVLDEGALYDALASGHLAGAGLDVHEREGDGVVPRLADLPNVVLTPHIGAMASDAQRQIGARVVELVDAYERGDLDIIARPGELVL